MKLLLALSIGLSSLALAGPIDPEKVHEVDQISLLPMLKCRVTQESFGVQGKRCTTLEDNVWTNIQRVIKAGSWVTSDGAPATHRTDIDVRFHFCFQGSAELALYMINYILASQYSDAEGVIWDAQLISTDTISIKSIEPMETSRPLPDQDFGTIYQTEIKACSW